MVRSICLRFHTKKGPLLLTVFVPAITKLSDGTALCKIVWTELQYMMMSFDIITPLKEIINSNLLSSHKQKKRGEPRDW